jgi:V/A-type H+-transporting ATPase subunit B
LTGYITEGQIVLLRSVAGKGVYPPIGALPSLSRLMKDGIGEGMTREDHKDVFSQVFAAYSQVSRIRNLASIIGDEELSETDREYLEFGRHLEEDFLSQGEYEDRSVIETLDLAWQMLKYLPRNELYRIDPVLLDKYLPLPPKEEAA